MPGPDTHSDRSRVGVPAFAPDIVYKQGVPTIDPSSAPGLVKGWLELVVPEINAADDDAMRRGRPAVHIEFGEGIAILVGDGLLTAAFGALAALGARAADAIAVLSRRAGAADLLAGQARDLALSGHGDSRPSPAQPGAAIGFELQAIHAAKTGSLFSAAAELGGIAGGADADQRRGLARFGLAIGVAFQHADDRDDEEFAEHTRRARERMTELTGEARELAQGFGPSGETLAAIARWMSSRA